ncbi:MAG: hypothetical protein Fur0037_22200 [Planctomycetota bacterium]
MIPSILLSFGLSSCLEMEQEIAIRADGSGALVMRLSATDAVFAEARRTMAVTAPEGGANPARIFDEKAVRSELSEAGLSLRSYETSSGAGRREVRLEAAFSSVEGLRRSPLLGGAAEWEFARGEKEGTIRIALYPQGRNAWLRARELADRLARGEDPTARSFFRSRKEKLRGLSVRLDLVLPGRVLKWTRTVERTGENRVSVAVTSESIKTPEDLVRRLAPRYEVVIDGRGLSLPLDR